MLCRLQGTDTTRPFGLRPEHQGLFVLAYFSFVCCFSRRLGAQLAPKPLPPVIAQTLQACLRHHWMVHLSECTCLCCEGCSWVSEGGRQVRQTARCLAALQRLALLGALPRHLRGLLAILSNLRLGKHIRHRNIALLAVLAVVVLLRVRVCPPALVYRLESGVVLLPVIGPGRRPLLLVCLLLILLIH